jgi:hypothetical protein
MCSHQETIGCFIALYGAGGGVFLGFKIYVLLAALIRSLSTPMLSHGVVDAFLLLLCLGSGGILGFITAYSLLGLMLGFDRARRQRHGWMDDAQEVEQAKKQWSERMGGTDRDPTCPTGIRRVEILDWGEVSAVGRQYKEEANKTTSGFVLRLDRLTIRRATDTVRAKSGTVIGIRFRVDGADFGERLTIRIRVHPPVAEQDAQGTQTAEEWEMPVNSGIPTVTAYEFEDEREIVPGIWTFQVIADQNVLAEKQLTVMPVRDSLGSAAHAQ